MRILLAILVLTTPALAADSVVHSDLAYAKPENVRQMLDVYAPVEGKDHPVVLWIHGGGWKEGDKSRVQKKPDAFVEKGFVFVSTNYRFVPKVTVKEMTGDVAKAIRWTHGHAQEYGGDPDAIFVVGYSAGAHLAALVCTDDRYLKAEGLSLSAIKGCVPIDVAAYDVAREIEDLKLIRPNVYTVAFGEDKAVQKELSPMRYIANDKNIPPFLILHVANRPDTKAQSQRFAEELQEAGVSATVVAAEGKTHATINSDLGLSTDKPTQELFEFFDGVLKK
jgi:arylformamidase